MKKSVVSGFAWVLVWMTATAQAQTTGGAARTRAEVPVPSPTRAVPPAPAGSSPAAAPVTSAPGDSEPDAPTSEQGGVAAAAPEAEEVELEEDEPARPPPRKPKRKRQVTTLNSADSMAGREEPEEGEESVPAVSPRGQRRARFHDGFYLQMALGLGYLRASASEGGEDLSVEGGAVTGSLWIGGSIAPGFVVGAGSLGTVAVSPSVTYANANDPSLNRSTSGVALQLEMFGLVSDLYPDPRSGLHFQTMFGYAVLSTSRNGDTSNGDGASGLGLMGGVGYDSWVGDDWSIGFLARVVYAATKFDSAGVSLNFPTVVPGVVATFTYN